jgi:hypothetical protein
MTSGGAEIGVPSKRRVPPNDTFEKLLREAACRHKPISHWLKEIRLSALCDCPRSRQGTCLAGVFLFECKPIRMAFLPSSDSSMRWSASRGDSMSLSFLNTNRAKRMSARAIFDEITRTECFGYGDRSRTLACASACRAGTPDESR